MTMTNSRGRRTQTMLLDIGYCADERRRGQKENEVSVWQKLRILAIVTKTNGISHRYGHGIPGNFLQPSMC